MKVILRTDVEKLGRLGDMVEVKPGYGRNYLLPHGFAMLATPANQKVFDLERKKLQAKTEALRASAASMADRLAATPISIAMRVGDNDKLYGSVTSTLIAEALLEKGIEIDRRRILLDAPIRALGQYAVRVRLHADVLGELDLSVVAERVHHEEEEQVQAPVASEDSDVANAEESAPAQTAE
ncbi:50S ribosomal protein L9 [Desulfovibrio sp. OttesenSCG-928-M14]|nr:50S ribosomal protein L9 [Desulfovibrio sp. OttesenSCG-928-M14]